MVEAWKQPSDTFFVLFDDTAAGITSLNAAGRQEIPCLPIARTRENRIATAARAPPPLQPRMRNEQSQTRMSSNHACVVVTGHECRRGCQEERGAAKGGQKHPGAARAFSIFPVSSHVHPIRIKLPRPLKGRVGGTIFEDLDRSSHLRER